MIPISYNLRNLKARKATTAAAVAGLSLVVFIFASVLMLSNGVVKALGRTARADEAIVLSKGAESELMSVVDEHNVGVVKGASQVARDEAGAPLAVGELVIVVVLDKVGAEGVGHVQVRGVPEGAMKLRPSLKVVEGRAPSAGTNEVIVGRAIRGRFKGVDLGQSFEIRRNRPFQVVGVFEDERSSFESEVWGDVHTLASSVDQEGALSSVRVRLVSPEQLDAFKAEIEGNRQLGMTVMSDAAYYEKQSEGTSMFIKGLGLTVAILFGGCAMLGAMITMHSLIANRQREIGTLRALGFSRIGILTSFLLESIILALIAGGIGALASLCMSAVTISTMNFATWSEIVFSFEPTLPILVQAVVFAGVMGLLGGFIPAFRASRMSPVEAMRG